MQTEGRGEHLRGDVALDQSVENSQTSKGGLTDRPRTAADGAPPASPSSPFLYCGVLVNAYLFFGRCTSRR